MTILTLVPAVQCGLVNDPDPVRDELPARPGYTTADECANCEASAATIAVLRAEVARLRAELATLRAERLTFTQRAAVLEADMLGAPFDEQFPTRETAQRGADGDVALQLVAREQEVAP